MRFVCKGLRTVRAGPSVRNADDAGRVFAHRLASKMFGRHARCLSISRVRGVRPATYMVEIGNSRMRATEIIRVEVRYGREE